MDCERTVGQSEVPFCYSSCPALSHSYNVVLAYAKRNQFDLSCHDAEYDWRSSRLPRASMRSASFRYICARSTTSQGATTLNAFNILPRHSALKTSRCDTEWRLRGRLQIQYVPRTIDIVYSQAGILPNWWFWVFSQFTRQAVSNNTCCWDGNAHGVPHSPGQHSWKTSKDLAQLVFGLDAASGTNGVDLIFGEFGAMY